MKVGKRHCHSGNVFFFKPEARPQALMQTLLGSRLFIFFISLGIQPIQTGLYFTRRLSAALVACAFFNTFIACFCTAGRSCQAEYG